MCGTPMEEGYSSTWNAREGMGFTKRGGVRIARDGVDASRSLAVGRLIVAYQAACSRLQVDPV